MECKMVSEKLHEYIYEELDEVTALEVEKHLESCIKCRLEHDEIIQLIRYSAKPLTDFKDKIGVPTDLLLRVKRSLNIRIRLKPLKYVLAACLAMVFFYTAPVFAYYADQIFPFDKYVDFIDAGTMKDFEEGRGQVVGKSCTMNGATFTVDGMINKGDYSYILFTIKVKKTDDYNYGMPPDFRGSITIQDQFGTKYRLGSGSGSGARVIDEGEFQYMFEIDEPISFWSTKLKVRITALELGYYDENKNTFDKYKNIYGNWNVSFYINRSSK